MEAARFDYTYDDLGRLTDAKNGVLDEHFDYDDNGNRTLGYNATAGTTHTGTYDDQDRLLSYGPATYTYTPNGELATRTTGGQTTTCGYDAFGNLLSVALPGGTTITCLVDGQNRRVGKRVNGVLTKQWLYKDSLRPVAELNGSGAVVARFVYGSDRNVPDFVVRGGNTYRVLADQLGSPRMAVNVANSSDVPFRAEYSGFGVQTMLAGTADWMPFGFAGGMYDAETGLVRFGARDYEPTSGRWAGKDPLRFDADGSNLYGYGLLDPVNTVDPSGRNPIVIVLTGCALQPEVCAAVLVGGAAAAAIVGHQLGKLLDKAAANDNSTPRASPRNPDECNARLSQCLDSPVNCPTGRYGYTVCRDCWNRCRAEGSWPATTYLGAACE